MIVTQFNVALGACAFTCAAALGSFVIPPPEHKFLTVHEIAQDGPQVVATRTVHGALQGGEAVPVLADWRVVVFLEDRPSPMCQTIPGNELHQGWSEYDPSPKRDRDMHLDVWVGDPGCYDRLPSGEYREHTSWTPRDGSAPVYFKRSFTKE